MPPQALSPNQIVWVEEPCLTLAQASACASGTSRALVTISRINLYLAPSAPCASRADLSRQGRWLKDRFCIVSDVYVGCVRNLIQRKFFVCIRL
jgi:hypothetical protein